MAADEHKAFGRVDHSFVYRSSRLISKFTASATGSIAFFGGFIDVLRFVLVFWLRSLGIFQSLPSGKLVSQTSRLAIRPALPTVEAFPSPGSPGCWFARSLRWFGQAVHSHLIRSHSAFAIVADGFDRTSFHGFLAKRFLLRGGVESHLKCGLLKSDRFHYRAWHGLLAGMVILVEASAT